PPWDRGLCKDEQRAQPALPGRVRIPHRGASDLWRGAAQPLTSLRGGIGDHGGEFALSCDFTVEERSPREFADAGPLLEEFDFKPKQYARLDGFPKLHP